MNILELVKKFPTQESCVKHLEQVRWNGKSKCVYCSSENTNPLVAELRHHCNGCRKSFSVTVGTIFHHTHVELQKWFLVMSLMLNARKGLSAYQISRDLGMRRPTVWKMMHTIRKAMGTNQAELLSGIVEMDETYIGGKPRRRNGDKDDNDNFPTIKRGRGTDKECVVGLIERGGKVRTQHQKKDVNKKLSFKALRDIVLKNVDMLQTTLMTDDFKGYKTFLIGLCLITQSITVVRSMLTALFTRILSRAFGQFLKEESKGNFTLLARNILADTWMSSAGVSTTKTTSLCLINF